MFNLYSVTRITESPSGMPPCPLATDGDGIPATRGGLCGAIGP